MSRRRTQQAEAVRRRSAVERTAREQHPAGPATDRLPHPLTRTATRTAVTSLAFYAPGPDRSAVASDGDRAVPTAPGQPPLRGTAADLARRYGVSGFVHDHVWPDDQDRLDRVLHDLSTPGAPELPFALCWRGAGGADAPAADQDAHVDLLLRRLEDPRCVRVDDLPLLLVDSTVPQALAHRTLAALRGRARDSGLGELVVVGLAGAAASVLAEGEPHADAAHRTPAGRPFRVVDLRPEHRPGDVTAALREAVRHGGTPAPVLLVGGLHAWSPEPLLEPARPGEHDRLAAHACAVGLSLPGTPVEVRDVLAANLRMLRQLEGRALELAFAGDDEAALRTVRAAADWAWYDHTGLFSSPLLEDLLDRIACRRLPPFSPAGRPSAAGRRVLHVLTEGYDVGGHTRLAWRWVEQDRTSTHDVVLTGDRPAPRALVDAVRRRDGRLHRLTAPSVLERSRELRRLADDVDVVVLHIHPFDVVAALAFSGRSETTGGPTTVLLNHADHVFWLGTAAADLVADLRDASDRVAVDRRGIDRGRLLRLSLPLDAPDTTLSRAAARAELGLPGDARIVLTAASPYKYAGLGPGSESFLDLVLPVVERREDVLLLAAGPMPSTPGWSEAAERTGGRVVPLGYRQDLETLRRAADVYVDSYPFGSMTSLLEAGLHGLPALSFLPHGDVLDVVSVACPGLAEGWSTASSVPDYQEQLVRLLDDERHRTTTGRTLAASVRAAHCGDAWQSQLEALHAAADRHRGRRRDRARTVPVPLVPGPLDDALLQLHQAGGVTRPAAGLLAGHGVHLEPVLPPLLQLSVVLAVDGDVEATMEALSTVLDSCSRAGRLEAVVLDNASTDGTAAALAALAEDVRSRRLDRAVPPSEAWRQAVAMATGELVLVVSNDVRLRDGFLPPLVGQLVDRADVGAAPLLRSGAATRSTAGLDSSSGVCFLVRRGDLVAGGPARIVTVDASVVDVVDVVDVAAATVGV